jgi:hypothetical protein
MGTTIARHVSGNLNFVVNTTPTDQLLTSFVMPFTGYLTIQAIVTFWGSAPGGANICSPVVQVSGTSSPQSNSPLQFVGPPAQAQSHNASVPIIGKWDSITGGTNVTIRMLYATNNSQLTAAHHCAVITAIPVML